MKLDYQIHHVIDNKYVNGRTKYDYVKSEVWLRTQELCDIINEEFGLDAVPETWYTITKNTAIEMWKFLRENKNLCGTYGDNFLNNWLN